MPAPSNRDAILNATIKIIAENGFAGLSTRSIAQEAGVTSPAIYNHFATLEELTSEALRRAIRPRIDLYRQLMRSEHPPRVKLKTMAVCLINNHQANMAMWNVYQQISLGVGSDEQAGVVSELHRSLYPEYLGCIAAIEPDLDARYVYFSMLAMIMGIIIYMPLHEGIDALSVQEKRPDQLAERVLMAVLPGHPWQSVKVCLPTG